MWTNYPPYIQQYSTKYSVDYLDCVSVSLCNIIYLMTGKLYSARALAQMSETDSTHGNNVAVVLWLADNFGLIPEELWPTSNDLTWDEFYAKVPQSVIDKAEKLDIVLIPPNLLKSPLWAEFEAVNSSTNKFYRHMVAKITDTQYVDSEWGGQIKTFTADKTIEYTTSIKINNPPTMSNTIFVHKTGTEEYGFYVPATTPDTIKDKALNFGLEITKPDGSVDFVQAKEINIS